MYTVQCTDDYIARYVNGAPIRPEVHALVFDGIEVPVVLRKYLLNFGYFLSGILLVISFHTGKITGIFRSG